jgi:glycosyltransferase involved in cell wall biosynthesis
MKNISFIIPAFNCGKTIEESINSILDTNFELGDEIVITNDYSTDDTLKKIKEIEKKNPDKIIIVNHEKNMGGGAARNTSVKNSKNELIFCLDSDNVLMPNSVKPLKKILLDNLENGAAAFQKINYFKKNINKVTHEWKYIDNKVTLRDALSGHMNPISSGNYIFTKDSWEKAGGYPEKVGALDAWGFGLKQLLTGSSILILPDTGYYHRYGHSSYWIRDNKSKSFSKKASVLIEPFLDKIFKDDIPYIKDSINWFEELKNKPIRDSNGLTGQDGIENIFTKGNQLEKLKKYVKKTFKKNN